MNIFKPLRDLIARIRGETEQETGFAGLSEGERQALDRLRETPGYEVFLNLLDRRISLMAEQLVSTRDDAEVHELRGHIKGLRDVPFVLEMSLKQEEHNHERRRQQRAAERAAADLNERLATFGTPAWDDERRNSGS